MGTKGASTAACGGPGASACLREPPSPGSPIPGCPPSLGPPISGHPPTLGTLCPIPGRPLSLGAPCNPGHPLPHPWAPPIPGCPEDRTQRWRPHKVGHLGADPSLTQRWVGGHPATRCRTPGGCGPAPPIPPGCGPRPAPLGRAGDPPVHPPQPSLGAPSPRRARGPPLPASTSAPTQLSQDPQLLDNFE